MIMATTWNAEQWTAAACRMQHRAELAALLGRTHEALNYCRRRNYAASKAQRLGGEPWGAIGQVIRSLDGAFIPLTQARPVRS
jgi:hypothetical protein